MVFHHAHGLKQTAFEHLIHRTQLQTNPNLHKGVQNGRADELEPAFDHGLAHGLSLRVAALVFVDGRRLQHDRLLIGQKGPQERVQRTELFLHSQHAYTT